MKNIRWIALFVLLTCVVTLVVSLLLPRQYTSSAVIFPTESNSLEDVIRNPQFGYDVEADRLMQLLQTSSIRDSIIRKFDLVDYYNIDQSRSDWYFRLKKKYEEDINFTKTVYMSVIIYARNKKPETAARIVNEIVYLLDHFREKMLKQNVFLALDALERESAILKADLDSLGLVVNSMTRNRKDVKQYVQNDRYISLILDKNQMSDDATGKALQMVVNQYNVKLGWYFDVQNKLKGANLMSRRPLPSVYIIERAVPSYRKSYPKTGINLLIAFAGSSVFITFFFFLIHRIRYIREQMTNE